MAKKGYSLGSLSDYVDTKFNSAGGEITGDTDVLGVLKEQGQRVYSPNNKPTAGDIGALPAQGKLVSSDVTSPVTLQGASAPTLMFEELDSGKRYLAVTDNYGFRLQEDSSSGRQVFSWALEDDEKRSFTTSGYINLANNGSPYIGQNGWQVNLVGADPIAITCKHLPEGANQYAGMGVHQNGGLYGWNTDSAQGYAFEISNVDFVVSRSFVTTKGSSSSGYNLGLDSYLTFNNSALWGNGVGWGIGEDGASGAIMFHTYNSKVWASTPYKFQHDGTLVAGGNGDFNDVYIRSDERLKSDRTPLVGALDKVCTLQGYTYTKHKSLSDDTVMGREAGILAQDLEKVLPEATHTAEDTQMTISNSGVNALLVEAVKELRAEVMELRALLEVK